MTTRSRDVSPLRRAQAGWMYAAESENMSIPRISKSRLAALAGAIVVALAGASCGGDATGPVRPPDETCPTAGAIPICQGDERADAAREAVADLVGRIAPKLENPSAREALVTGLGQLAIEAGLGNVTAGRRALAFSRDALAAALAQRTTYPGDVPDLGAIELELDRMAILLGTT
jgi:hypothetical protein